VSVAEQKKLYEVMLPYMGRMGHRYIGFDGKKCSRLETDDRARAMEECAWVWDRREKRWLKTP